MCACTWPLSVPFPSLNAQSRFELSVSLALESPDALSYLISTLFISTELNEREGFQRLSLWTVSVHSKARSLFPDADSSTTPAAQFLEKSKLLYCICYHLRRVMWVTLARKEWLANAENR